MQLPTINKILIVGLGNTGKKYDATPHNIGFAVIDELANGKWPASPKTASRGGQMANGVKEKHTKFAEIHEIETNNTLVILAKPRTFINESGSAVLALTKSHNLKPKTSLWLVHDDIDLPLGTIRVQFGRGSAGHKGVTDVIDKLATQDFWRFRIGVRPPRVPRLRSRQWMNKFVTQPAIGERKKKLETISHKCAQLIEEALEKGIDKISGDH